MRNALKKSKKLRRVAGFMTEWKTTFSIPRISPLRPTCRDINIDRAFPASDVRLQMNHTQYFLGQPDKILHRRQIDIKVHEVFASTEGRQTTVPDASTIERLLTLIDSDTLPVDQTCLRWLRLERHCHDCGIKRRANLRVNSNVNYTIGDFLDNMCNHFVCHCADKGGPHRPIEATKSRSQRSQDWKAWGMAYGYYGQDEAALKSTRGLSAEKIEYFV